MENLYILLSPKPDRTKWQVQKQNKKITDYNMFARAIQRFIAAWDQGHIAWGPSNHAVICLLYPKSQQFLFFLFLLCLCSITELISSSFTYHWLISSSFTYHWTNIIIIYIWKSLEKFKISYVLHFHCSCLNWKQTIFVSLLFQTRKRATQNYASSLFPNNWMALSRPYLMARSAIWLDNISLRYNNRW